MDKYLIIKPEGRRKSWSVRGYYKGRWIATWTCDSKEIAGLVAKRLKKGRAPGWAARDLRSRRTR